MIYEHLDTIPLGSAINVNGVSIDILCHPDKDTSFEKKIREFTGQNNKIWFNEAIKPNEKRINANPFSDFAEEIHNQGLDVDLVKDVLFQAALCGLHIGYYKQGLHETEYHEIKEMPKELLYLSAMGLVIEDLPGNNYNTGRQLIYYISNDAYDLSDWLIDEKINKGNKMLQQIIEKYGESVVLISLIGKMGKFIDYKSLDDPLPLSYAYNISWDNEKRNILKEFNIDLTIASTNTVVARSPLFLETLRQVYNDFIDSQLGNEIGFFTSNGYFHGEIYCIPINALLRKLNVEKWVKSPQINKLKLYAEWLILRAQNPIATDMLYDLFKAIGANNNDAKVLIEELVQQGITSKLIRGGTSTVTIYDKKRFNNYCDKKMANILQDILKNNE